jgi:hypothetical protein
VENSDDQKKGIKKRFEEKDHEKKDLQLSEAGMLRGILHTLTRF